MAADAMTRIPKAFPSGPERPEMGWKVGTQSVSDEGDRYIAGIPFSWGLNRFCGKNIGKAPNNIMRFGQIGSQKA